MKNILIILSLVSFSMSVVHAERLTTLNVKNWLSYHAVSKGKYHVIAVKPDGKVDLFFLKREERLNIGTPVELEMKIERRLKKADSKWSAKRVTIDGFINPPKPSENPKKHTLHGVVTGGVEFQIDFTFTKEGVLMKAAFGAKPKDADEAEYRLSLVSDIEEMYSVSKTAKDEEKDIKSKTRGCELRIQTREGKPERIKFHAPIEVEDLEKKEIIALELKAEKIGRKKLYWSLANPKLGSIQIDPDADSKMPYKGFKLSTVLVDETGKKRGEGILLEYK